MIIKTPQSPRGRNNLAAFVYRANLKIAARKLGKEA